MDLSTILVVGGVILFSAWAVRRSIRRRQERAAHTIYVVHRRESRNAARIVQPHLPRGRRRRR